MNNQERLAWKYQLQIGNSVQQKQNKKKKKTGLIMRLHKNGKERERDDQRP